MKTNALLMELARSAWHMEPLHAISLMPLAHRFITGQSISGHYPEGIERPARDDRHPLQALSEDIKSLLVDRDGNAYYTWQLAEDDEEFALPEGEYVSILPIRGTIFKYGSSLAYGITEITDLMKLADADPRVIAHATPFDTPGGSVYGTIECTPQIKALTKPKVAMVDSMCCSAGMELFSAFDEGYANHAKALMGSIGTMMAYMDWVPYYEKEGAKWHEIYATASKLKNKLHRDADEGNYDPIIKELLDPLNEDFLATMRQNIPAIGELSQKDQDWILSGPTFFAEKALSYNLIQGISTFEAVIERAFELGQSAKAKRKVKYTL